MLLTMYSEQATEAKTANCSKPWTTIYNVRLGSFSGVHSVFTISPSLRGNGRGNTGRSYIDKVLLLAVADINMLIA